MIKGSANLCSALVLLAITLAVASDTNISHQIEEINKILTYLSYLQGNVSVLQHRVEVNESKCAENVTKQINESNGKLNALESKINALATTVSISVAKYSENANVQSNEANGKLNNLEDKINSHDNKLNILLAKLNALATAVTNLVGDNKEILLKPLSSCEDAFVRPLLNRGSGVYNIQLNINSLPFDVYCMADPQGGLPWTVVQRRVDGSVDFYRNWAEYQKGFGDLETNFFIGLDNLHSLTTTGGPQELWVMLIDRNGLDAHAYYDAFAIGNEAEKYALNVLGAYSTDAGDSLTYHKSMQFSTHDNDNDLNETNCAEYFKSAWWFHDCQYCQLNGVYGSHMGGGGVHWVDFRDGSAEPTYAHMAIRPARKLTAPTKE